MIKIKKKKVILFFFKYIIFIFFYIFLPLFLSFLFFFFQNKYITAIKTTFPIHLTIYDKNKNKLKICDEAVQFSSLPDSLIHAFIAKEDADFFSHPGFSLKSIMRSFLVNLKNKRIAQGGSTITQQLVKLYLDDLSKTISRKIKELFVAIGIEICFTKEEIFESYCNILNFGGGVFGVSLASSIFFNKSYKDLTIDECALLAGIVQLPEYFNPLRNKKKSIERRNIVLKRMLSEGFISQKDYQQSVAKDTVIYNTNVIEKNKSIKRIIKYLLKKNNLSLSNEYVVFTSIDSELQVNVYELLKKKTKGLLSKCPKIEASVIVIDYKENKVVAIAESKLGEEESVFSEKKHIGSLIKPFIVYFGFLNNDTKDTVYFDLPLEAEFNYNPQNHYKKYIGKMNVRDALIRSNNIIPIRILKKYGIHNFISLIKPFFMTSIEPFWSLGLGCISASIFEIASLYSVFFSSGQPCKPIFIESVYQKAGGVIYEETQELTPFFFDQNKVEEVKNILSEIGEFFKKKYNLLISGKIYAKTGTTNGGVDCWAMAANDQYCVISHIGTRENLLLFKNYSVNAANSAMPIAFEIIASLC